MTAKDFVKLKETNTPCILLDVRTDEELEIARVDPCTHIPLHELKARVGELQEYRETPLVCMCHHGVRSAMAAGFLREQGFAVVHNLEGGIDAYAREVDPGLTRY